MCDLYYCDLIYMNNEPLRPKRIKIELYDEDEDNDILDIGFDEDIWMGEFIKFDPDDELNIKEQKIIRNTNKGKQNEIQNNEKNIEIFLKCHLLSLYQYKYEQIRKKGGNLQLFTNNYKKTARNIIDEFHTYSNKNLAYGEIINEISRGKVWTSELE
jgi:hypothetical protein